MSEAEKIKFHFNRASKSYDDHCQLQIDVGKRLINYIQQYQSSSARIIDLGCGTGIVTQQCASAFRYEEFHAVDIANALLIKASERLSPLKVKVYETNFDQLPDYHSPFDLAFSNMSLQWSADLNSTLAAIKNLIHANGSLAFSIPLAGTLAELKYNFSLNHFLSFDSIQEQLLQNGYEILFSQQEKTALHFDNLLSMLKSIKDIGANYVGKRLNKGLRGKGFLQVRTAQQLTYVMGYFIAKKR